MLWVHNGESDLFEGCSDLGQSRSEPIPNFLLPMDNYICRPKAGGCWERLTNTCMVTSEARDMESTEVVSNETDTTVVNQRSAGTETTDSEMSIAPAVDGDCDSDASTVTNQHMQRGSGDPEKGLDGVAPFIERDPDNVAWTSGLEWRGTVVHSQDATQVTSFRQQLAAEERRRASLEIKIERIRQRYHEQERILEREVMKHEQRYKWAIEQLEKEEKDGEDCNVAGWWEVQSDYQPTECGNDGSR